VWRILYVINQIKSIGGAIMIFDKKAFSRISYGVYIISSKWQDRINGMIATTVFQVTSEPSAVAVTINKQNLTHEFIEKSKFFSITVLAQETSFNFIGRFGFRTGREFDKFKDVSYKEGISGSPVVIDNAVGYIEAEVISQLDVGTHTIFIGKVMEAQVISAQEPLTYAYYHQIKGGKSPKNAPTYINESKEK